MRICVAGGAGYIGSHVVLHLLEAGHEIVVLDNLLTGHRSSVPAQARFVHGDIADSRACAAAFAGCEGLVHLAALKAAGESMLDPLRYTRANLIGTMNLLEAAVEHGVKHLVFSSSAAVYGSPRYSPIDEKHPTDPENYYGFTKLEIERVLRWYDMLKGLKSACLRYFNAAGYDPAGRLVGLERNPANLLPVVMEVACGVRRELHVFGNDYDTPDGTGVRDYIHVTDLADAHVRAMEYLAAGGDSFIVNLGTGFGTSVVEVADTAERITGRKVARVFDPRRPGDPAALWASSEEARRLLGWQARHSSIDEIVATTWNAYRANGLVEPQAGEAAALDGSPRVEMRSPNLAKG